MNTKQNRSRSRNRNQGFTVLEMALALFSAGFLLAAVPRLVTQGHDVMASAPGSQPVEAAELALKGFILKNNRLPCPASTTAAGTENCTLTQGYVPWRTLGQPRPATNSDGHAFAYAVLKGSNNLSSASSAYVPKYLASGDNYESDPTRVSSSETNGLDLCVKLRTQAALPLDATLLRVRDAAARTTLTRASNVAWVLVDPGSLDPSFNGDNDPATSVAFESPGRAQAKDYDDKVTVGTLTQLFGELRCPELLAAVSAAAREADFANDSWRVRKYLYDFRSYELKVREQKKIQADNFKLLAIFDLSLTVALTALDLGIALAGPAGAATIAAGLVNAVISISMGAINMDNAISSVDDAVAEVAEGKTRKSDALAAVSDAATFRTERRAALVLLDQRGWFQ
jgi:hypothetical protein